jgi:hypothetical protein
MGQDPAVIGDRPVSGKQILTLTVRSWPGHCRSVAQSLSDPLIGLAPEI